MHAPSPDAPRQRGFTLLELIVVLAIIGIIASGAVLALGLIERGSPLQQHVRQLLRSIDYLQQRSLLGSQSLALVHHQGQLEVLQRFQDRWRTLESLPVQWPQAGSYRYRLQGAELQLSESRQAWLFFPDGQSSGGSLQVLDDERNGLILTLEQSGQIGITGDDDS